jgi:hypothetical protein
MNAREHQRLNTTNLETTWPAKVPVNSTTKANNNEQIQNCRRNKQQTQDALQNISSATSWDANQALKEVRDHVGHKDHNISQCTIQHEIMVRENL